MTLSELFSKLNELVVNDQLQEALKLLKKFSKSSSEFSASASAKDAVIDLIRNTQGRLNGLERDQNLGVIKGDDYRIEMNAIRQTILTIQDAIQDLVDGVTPGGLLPPQPATTRGATQIVQIPASRADNLLKYVILGFAGLCAITFFIFLFMGDMLEGAALSFTGVAGSIYGYMRFRIMETTLQFVNSAPAQIDSAALSAALSRNILNPRK